MAGAAKLIIGTLSPVKKCLTSRDILNNTLAINGIRYFSVSRSRKMKFIQFTYKKNPEEIRVGFIQNAGKGCGDDINIVDINKVDPCLPNTFLGILKNGSIDKVRQIANPPTVPFNTVNLAPPIHGIDKIICIGLNYKDHCEEQNLTPPEVPMFFSKFPSAIIGPCDSVRLRTEVTQKVDWEAELVVVIGKKACFVKAADAYSYIAGYTIAQDISARDWQKQKNGGQFLLGKSMDTFCPIGPYIVTGDETGDPQCLNIQCSVNGVLKQKSNTCQLINKIPDVIERLTSVMTLLPGDIILTGTPGGVGMYRDPPEYLRPGDVINTKIENIGELETRVEKF